VPTAPYGSWRSPIDGDTVARDRGWGYSMVTPHAGAVHWSEARPLEGGRDAIVVRRPGGAPADALPPGCSARTRVHEYGGGAFTVHGETVFFCNDADQRIHRLDPGGAPRPITPAPDVPFGLRYADLRVTPDGRRLVCVRERDARPEHVNELVALPADGSAEPRVVAGGHDFFAAPRVSPDGTQLAWLSWDHPRMPWEGCELWLASLSPDAGVADVGCVAGGPEEALVQPAWSPDGVLHFSSDRSGWWNLHRLGADGVEALTAVEAELGGPMWVFGQSWYDFLADGRIVCTYSSDGVDHVAVLEEPGRLRTVECGLTSIADVTADGDHAVLVGASPTSSPRVLAVDLESGELTPLSEDEAEHVEPGYVSVPRPLDYRTTGGATAHALFYPPHNPEFAGPPDERPPLLVRVHGGPTAHVTPRLSPGVQFWTTRGFAVVDVNYGGSTGYGREYRERLRGAWGVVDTDDAVNAARALAGAGEVDGRRMVISGGSAGGWTVLCALAFHDVFAAGADHFGVADLSGFMDDTHKFESRYTDWLVGPLPDAEDLWRERSPVNHADDIRAPVIVLQGLEDRVVPPSQSERVVEALERNGVPHAYLTFEGEQHGFRRAETVRRVMDAQLSFYAQVLGFEPADAVEPVALVR
jgi:dipeptidyl aminopeptidase/acylaminoacyl peptidase